MSKRHWITIDLGTTLPRGLSASSLKGLTSSSSTHCLHGSAQCPPDLLAM